MKKQLEHKLYTYLYKLSELKYNNAYSAAYKNPSSLIDTIIVLDELYLECFGNSYLKDKKEFNGYCDWTINTTDINWER